MSTLTKGNVILTSSFNTVAAELWEKGSLPAKASIAFIPTAGNPYEERPWIDADRRALIGLGYDVTDVDLKGKDSDALKRELSSFDVIFVAGGNTTYLAAQSRFSGFHGTARDLLRQGKLYIGSSAGSILAGPTVEPFIKEDLPELPSDFAIEDPTCLGFVDYIVLPHYPAFAEVNDRLAKQYGERFHFVKLTDREYRVERI